MQTSEKAIANEKKTARTSRFTLQKMVIIAMLAAVSTVAYYLIEVPIIPFAPHLKVNFADIPALLGGLVLGPLATVVITLLRCVLHLFKSSTAGIGELVDFMVGCAMMVPMIVIYRRLTAKLKSHKAYVIAAAIAVITTIIGGIIANLLLYPVFMYLVLGVGIESTEVFIAYLGGTVVTNLVRGLVTVIATGIFVPLIPTIKKAASLQ